jgi:uncharacterized membrane protein
MNGPWTRLAARLAGNKYRLMVFALLAGATIMSLGLWRLRAALTGSLGFAFLIWNLFLAWIPFLIAYAVHSLPGRRPSRFVLILVAAFLWLIFLPNAPYVLTDFQHLRNPVADSPIWFDVLLLIWFAFTSLLLGLVSLFLMQDVVRREFGRWTGWAFVAGVTVLASAGVYVGRFLRWNSWDILQQPGHLALFTLQRAQDPSLRSVVFTGMYAAFFLFLYLTLYAFGHLLAERRGDPPLKP